jgi:hypothetical protein
MLWATTHCVFSLVQPFEELYKDIWSNKHDGKPQKDLRGLEGILEQEWAVVNKHSGVKGT